MKLRLFAVMGVSSFFWCVGCGTNPDGSDAGTSGMPVLSSTGSAGLSGTAGVPVGQTVAGSSSVGSGLAGIGGSPIATGGIAGVGGSPTLGVAGIGLAGAGGATLAGSGGASGAASTAGASAAGTGGAGGSSGTTGTADDPCAGGMVFPKSDDKTSTAKAYGAGDVELTTDTKNQILSLETTLTVPKKPPASGTLFLWPGLEPLTASAHYNPVGIGVLQPVLTWGGTCAPGAPSDYKSWWISAQYVGNPGGDANHANCHGGPGMTVEVGDQLHMLMSVKGTIWTQVVTDMNTGKMVSFDIDMLGQAQNWVIYEIEAPTGTEPVDDVVFTSNVFTFQNPEPAAHCVPSVHGTKDWFSAPESSKDGTQCCIAKIIMRGTGVAASGPNM